MEKFDKLLEELNSLKLIQLAGDWVDNIPRDIWEEHFKNNVQGVKYKLNINTHRWYETSITVIVIYNRFLGIEYITNIFSESQDYEDCYHRIKFYEMEAIKVTSYKIKT